MIHNIFIFTALALLFLGKASAHGPLLTESSIVTSINVESTVQQKSSITKLFVIDSQTELVVNTSTTDGYSLDYFTITIKGLLKRSQLLTSVSINRLLLYAHLSFQHSYKKALIFPFHTFW
ncbi:hypothetical protein [Nonlabens ulvanivorans]|uniref:hypothetical protein n=2 Tax=Nonlabens ulvanivorans TaxID=906888 RepID=UPI00326712D1